MKKINLEKDLKILSPKEFSGSIYGDYGFSIDGEKSEKGYASENGASNALDRELDRMVARGEVEFY